MLEWVPINFDLLKHPLNWLIIFFMVTVPLIGFVIVQEKLTDKDDKES